MAETRNNLRLTIAQKREIRRAVIHHTLEKSGDNPRQMPLQRRDRVQIGTGCYRRHVSQVE